MVEEWLTTPWGRSTVVVETKVETELTSQVDAADGSDDRGGGGDPEGCGGARKEEPDRAGGTRHSGRVESQGSGC